MYCEATEAWRVTGFAARTPAQTAAPLIQFHSMARYEAGPAYYVRREGLSEWLFAYTLSGKGRLTYEGATYALTRGTVFLIDCRRAQEYRTAGDGWEFLWVHFAGRLADEYAGYVAGLRGAVMQAGADCVSQWHTIHDLAAGSESGNEALLSAAVYQLLTLLLASRLADERIEAAIAYMQEHLSDPVTVEKLASEACMSPFHFQRQFKKATGMTPHLYLSRLRINRAKQLLATTDQPVAAVAEQTGFSSGSHFAETFHRLSGQTPRDYRRDPR